MSLRILFIRHLILELANVADLASVSGSLYQDCSDLGKLHRPIRTALEFFKYLRNIYVGHFNPSLTDKTFEWRPESNDVVMRSGLEPSCFLSLIALETAINTYADPETGHKIFDSDTDLFYPPDNTRFLYLLGDTVLGALSYLTALIDEVRSRAGLPDYQEKMFELAMIAGATDFSVLTKGKR